MTWTDTSDADDTRVASLTQDAREGHVIRLRPLILLVVLGALAVLWQTQRMRAPSVPASTADSKFPLYNPVTEWTEDDLNPMWKNLEEAREQWRAA